jgi:hypothetical protein
LPTNAPTSASSVPKLFVILEHTGTVSYKPGVHWDLLCEEGEDLRAWEFSEPITVPRQKIIALPAHRRMYLDYQGPISGDRGTVRQVAEGTFELLQDSPVQWTIRLHGIALQGELRLSRQTLEQLSWDAVFSSTR